MRLSSIINLLKFILKCIAHFPVRSTYASSFSIVFQTAFSWKVFSVFILAFFNAVCAIRQALLWKDSTSLFEEAANPLTIASES